MASAYGLFLSTAFADPEVALALIPVLIIPLLLVGGLFAPLERVPKFFYIFEYISVFKYNYQALVYSQFHDRTDGFSVNLNGETFTYEGNIMAEGNQLYFRESYWLVMFLMGIIGLAFRALSLVALYIISNPKSLKLSPPDASPAGNNNIQSNNNI